MSRRNVLDRAADILERDGLTHHVYHGNDGTHCMAGAVALAAGFHSVEYSDAPTAHVVTSFWNEHKPLYSRALAVLASVLPGRTTDDTFGRVVRYSDHHVKRTATAVRRLREAAEVMREQNRKTRKA